ncbi:Smad nuclear-interacting protein 1 [Halotydeus destructor]|nr:Smad nuclear-interacting protein 1 [Halotydeus destructor]
MDRREGRYARDSDRGDQREHRDRRRDEPRRHRRSRSRSKERNIKDARRLDERGDRGRFGNDRNRNTRERGDRDRESVPVDWRDREVKREKGSFDRRDQDRPSTQQDEKPEVPIEKEKPSFGLSGKLAEDTNKFNGIVIKYNEPAEAKKPKRKWRLYPFKGEEALEFIPMFKQSAFLLGRERKVADIPLDHPSCSSQHAVIQFKAVEFEREDGTIGKRTRPYLIDLDSSNGTYLNHKRIESRRYHEVFEKDVVKFGFSTREYVIMFEEYSESDDEEPPAEELPKE